jgi:hypothetical protein
MGRQWRRGKLIYSIVAMEEGDKRRFGPLITSRRDLRSFQNPSDSEKTGRHYVLGDAAHHRGQPMRSTTMTYRFIGLAVATALAAGLGACAAPALPSRLASAQSASATAPLAVVHSPVNCSDENGFIGYGRYFGNTTAWSENPFLNPCWPN